MKHKRGALICQNVKSAIVSICHVQAISVNTYYIKSGTLLLDQTLTALLRMGAEMSDLRVPGTKLPPLNDSQRDAVHAALEKPFSIIQGPPGKHFSVLD